MVVFYYSLQRHEFKYLWWKLEGGTEVRGKERVWW